MSTALGTGLPSAACPMEDVFEARKHSKPVFGSNENLDPNIRSLASPQQSYVLQSTSRGAATPAPRRMSSSNTSVEPSVTSSGELSRSRGFQQLKSLARLSSSAKSGRPFGGITIVFGGDFRQILPVIPKATRAQIVKAALNSSKLWDRCTVFLLNQNMRLSGGKSALEKKELAEFSRWVLDVGNGKIPNVHPDDTVNDPDVVIPDKFLIPTTNSPIKDIVDTIYPNIREIFSNPEYLRHRSILTPTNAIVGDINSYILDQIPGTIHTYYSQDSLCDSLCTSKDFGSGFPIEYLNSINMPCLPRHDLRIKVGSVIMLMRNLNQIMGLCNGTRMIVRKCLPNSIVCEILTGSQVGSTHIIPRIEMEPSDSNWPVEFKRVQFPVQLCFAMTINKSQGQSLDKVGLYLPRSVFTHGQLYVAVSRVTSPGGLHILIDSDSGGSTNLTANVVFEEVFYNLPS